METPNSDSGQEFKIHVKLARLSAWKICKCAAEQIKRSEQEPISSDQKEGLVTRDDLLGDKRRDQLQLPLMKAVVDQSALSKIKKMALKWFTWLSLQDVLRPSGKAM